MGRPEGVGKWGPLDSRERPRGKAAGMEHLRARPLHGPPARGGRAAPARPVHAESWAYRTGTEPNKSRVADAVGTAAADAAGAAARFFCRRLPNRVLRMTV